MIKKIFLFALFSTLSLTAWAQTSNDSLVVDTNEQAVSETASETTSTDASNVEGETAKTPMSALGGNDALWAAANESYRQGQYPKAVSDYEAILASGESSAALFFNLGNAYFQQNRLGKALVNYYRAQNLDPRDEDILYNLELAQARTKDKIEAVPQIFFVRWFRSLGGLIGSNGWAALSLVMLVVSLLSLMLWLLGRAMALRKAGFFVGMVCGVLFVISLGYSFATASNQFKSSGAVVINSAAPVKSSPSSGSTDLFIVNEGTYLDVLQTLDEWSEIRLADGNKGWMLSTAIESLR